MTLIGFVAACSGSAVGTALVPCELDAQSARLAGAATDCGRATYASTAATNACVKDALARGAAFRAIYELRGFDSKPVVAIVRDAAGTASLISYDEDPTLGSPEMQRWSCPSLGLVADSEGIERYQCQGSAQKLELLCTR